MNKPNSPHTAIETQEFAVAAHDVWAYRLDFTHLPEYNPDVSGVERIAEGSGDGGVHGAGARYRFQLRNPHRPEPQPVELWTVEARDAELVSAGMNGGSEAYEEFVLTALGPDRCTATLTLWVTTPEGLADDVVAAIAESGRQQIRKELDLMVAVLEPGADHLGAR